MTASSLDFFPCRVQLMGLQSREVSRVQAPPTRPPEAKVQRISRNLFGAPEPGFVSGMLREECQRQRSYVLQRYNFDLNTVLPRPNNTEATKQSTAVATEEHKDLTTDVRPLPKLISQELQKHEQRLQQEECNLSRAHCEHDETAPTAPAINAKSSSSPKQIKRTASYRTNSGASEIMSTTSASSSILNSSGSSSDRLKPYARQTLLTDCFNLRKAPPTPHLNGKTAQQRSAAAINNNNNNNNNNVNDSVNNDNGASPQSCAIAAAPMRVATSMAASNSSAKSSEPNDMDFHHHQQLQQKQQHHQKQQQQEQQEQQQHKSMLEAPLLSSKSSLVSLTLSSTPVLLALSNSTSSASGAEEYQS